MGICQSKCAPNIDDTSNIGGAPGPFNAHAEVPAITFSAETHSNLTLLRVNRDKAVSLLPNGATLASKEELVQVYPEIGTKIRILDRSWEKIGYLDFDMFMIIVPFCKLDKGRGRAGLLDVPTHYAIFFLGVLR
jgi:hypothetical protein